MILLLLFFVLAAAADWFSVLWYEAREHRKVGRLALLSMAIETLAWVPIWFALTSGDYRIALVSIAGSGAGAALGLARVTRQKSNPVVDAGATPPARPPTT